MPKSRPPYTAELRSQMVELVHAGRPLRPRLLAPASLKPAHPIDRSARLRSTAYYQIDTPVFAV